MLHFAVAFIMLGERHSREHVRGNQLERGALVCLLADHEEIEST